MKAKKVAVKALLMDTLVNERTYGHLQKTLFFSTPHDTSSVFLHSNKQPAPVTDTFFYIPRVSAY